MEPRRRPQLRRAARRAGSAPTPPRLSEPPAEAPPTPARRPAAGSGRSSFVIEALPAEAFEALLVVAS
jgi:hypothetical protein